MKRGDKIDGNCTVCGELVKRIDSAVHIESHIDGRGGILMMAAPKHIQCSPSRAQWINHPEFEPVVDDRPEYDRRQLDLDDSFIARKAESTAMAWNDAWIAHLASCKKEEVK